ncbi:hypothetical protein G9A89_007156 [Geosiphon pyriformis]|nr:hypothetical protein G9A89_007156 [Geosiphon pyriformis]
MKNKEIKRTHLEAHDCNECKQCQESILNNKLNLCATCHGNDEVDEIINNPIYIPPDNEWECGSLNYYEWITWESLFNIKEIARGGFSIIYKATLIDGLIDSLSIKHYGSMEYERIIYGENFDELNLQRVMFITNGYLGDISKIWGIKQNAETLEYGIIACNIISGLDAIYLSCSVHRDLNSGNILQLINNEATTTTTTTTEEKKIYGVIPYIPPEVLRGEKFTFAGNIYSFAMLLWELATGILPFHDCSHDHLLIMDILNSIRPEIISPFIPPSIAEIIIKCWDVNPENRSTTREKRDYIPTPLTTKIKIHPGAVYTSRLLTAQMVDFSKD